MKLREEMKKKKEIDKRIDEINSGRERENGSYIVNLAM